MTRGEKTARALKRARAVRRLVRTLGGNKSAAARELGISLNRVKQILQRAAELEGDSGPDS